MKPPLAAECREKFLNREQSAEVIDQKCRVISEHVAQSFAIPVEDLLGRSKKSYHTWPRQVAMAFSLELVGSSTEVGQRFQRDHVTVLHARDQMQRFCSIYPDVRQEVSLLREQLTKLVAEVK